MILPGCLLETQPATQTAGITPDPVDPIRKADTKARWPAQNASNADSSQGFWSRPMLFPGADPDAPAGRRADDPSAPTGPGARYAAAESGATVRGTGVEINFENADIQTVARSLLGDILELNFVVDPRVQGTVTLASVGPIARKDILPIFESVLRMSNAAIVRDGALLKIVPISETGGAGAITLGAGQPGFGVSVIPLRYTSAATVAKTAENFLSRPGAIRVDQARNILLVQGTTAERQAALDVVATFDVEWLRNQSVGVYPIRSTAPETLIPELEKIFDSGENGQGQGVVRFQPISRMNAVMAVAKNPKLLDRVTQWVARLDRGDVTGTMLRTYRLKNTQAVQVTKILNDIFLSPQGGANTNETPAGQLAPGTTGAQSRLDQVGGGGAFGAAAGGGGTGAMAVATTPPAGPLGAGSSPNLAGGSIASAFQGFAGAKPDSDQNKGPGAAGAGGPNARGVFPNLRITADVGNNAVVVYSNQEDWRAIERALHELDRAKLQVSIEATVAEVTLTDQIQYGVQYYLQFGNDKGSVGLLNAATSTAKTALLSQVIPGGNLLLGPASQPHVILNALQSITNVKVLSSPSVVVLDDQPAMLEVGDQVPISTGSATVLTTQNTVVNTIQMQPTGVILKVLPHVHSNGSVQLEIDQEISSVANPGTATTPNLTPTITERRIHSTVAVTSGQTVLLGGLISESDEKDKSGIPGAMQIKYLGDLLANTTGNKQRSEIIVFIKPQVIRNSMDAENVTEAFRDRLDSMRKVPTVIRRTDAPPPPRVGPVVP